MKSKGMVFRKRNEKTVMRECMNVLQVLKNSGEVVWFDRLNSGKVCIQEPYRRPRWVKLCEEGTPDIYCRLPNGNTVWIETKSNTGKLSKAQIDFRLQAELLGDTYLIIRRVEDLLRYLKKSPDCKTGNKNLGRSKNKNVSMAHIVLRSSGRGNKSSWTQVKNIF